MVYPLLNLFRKFCLTFHSVNLKKKKIFVNYDDSSYSESSRSLKSVGKMIYLEKIPLEGFERKPERKVGALVTKLRIWT